MGNNGILVFIFRKDVWRCKWNTEIYGILDPQVCELDIIFNFEKAYFILDEFLLGGEPQETSKKNVLKAIEQADLLQEVKICFHMCKVSPL